MQNFVEDYTITYKNAILDSCLSGWLAGWLAVCGTQKGPTSLTTIAKKTTKKESALCNISNSSWNTPGGAAAEAAAKVGGSYRRTTGYEKLK